MHTLTYDNGKELTEHEQIAPRRWERRFTLPILPVRTEIRSYYPLETTKSQSIDLTREVSTPSKCLVAVEARINRIPIDKDSFSCYRLHELTMESLADRGDRECCRERDI